MIKFCLHSANPGPTSPSSEKMLSPSSIFDNSSVFFVKLNVDSPKKSNKNRDVGGFNPTENIGQIRNLPQIGVKINTV